MIRNLLVITGVGFALAVIGLGGAVALVRNDVERHDWTWVVTEDSPGGDHFRLEKGAVDPEVNRTLAWSGSDRLSIRVPGQVIYRQGAEAGVVVTGPRAMAEKVRLQDGRLTLEGYDEDAPERGYIRWSRNGIHVWDASDALKVVITAPSVTAFDMGDAGGLSIRDYDQPTLDLTMDGAGDVAARGRTPRLTLTVNGAGDADLEDLLVTDAAVEVNGRGDVRVGPTGRADIDISGHGDVTLTRAPDQVNQTITGWGEVELH